MFEGRINLNMAFAFQASTTFLSRRRPKQPISCGMDSGIDDEYPDRKSPMYDEISLPFIDASLPPTPKIGRVVNGLDILLGRENSQVGECHFL